MTKTAKSGSWYTDPDGLRIEATCRTTGLTSCYSNPGPISRIPAASAILASARLRQSLLVAIDIA